MLEFIHCDICYFVCVTSDKFCSFCGRLLETNKLQPVPTTDPEFEHREAVRIHNVAVHKRGWKEVKKSVARSKGLL